MAHKKSKSFRSGPNLEESELPIFASVCELQPVVSFSNIQRGTWPLTVLIVRVSLALP